MYKRRNSRLCVPRAKVVSSFAGGLAPRLPTAPWVGIGLGSRLKMGKAEELDVAPRRSTSAGACHWTPLTLSRQASARLEQLLQQTNMAGRQRPALLTAGSVDTISTPPVEVSPPTPTPKAPGLRAWRRRQGDEPVMLRPSEAWEVAPPPSEQAWVWYPAPRPLK